MKDQDCVRFLQWLLPQLQMRWPGFRKVRRQVCKRVQRRLNELELADIASYQSWVDAHPEELEILDSLCRITISRFYRDRAVFDHLRDTTLAELAVRARQRGDHEMRCWSAGCASGEEPYTINMIWRKANSPNYPDLKLRIIATDSDPMMLDRARRASYPRGSLKDLPDGWIGDCFQSVNDELEVRELYRRGIEWYQQDIRQELPAGLFDLVLCRHLAFTYFDQTLQIKTLDRILSRLRSGGILVTGKQEPLPKNTSKLIETSPRTSVYRKQ